MSNAQDMTNGSTKTNGSTSYRAGRPLRAVATLALVCAAMLTVAPLAFAQEPTTSDPTGGNVFASGDLSGSSLAPNGSASTSGATIASDQADYGPGATVTLTGSGWQPGESVRIVVDDDGLQEQVWQRDVTITADSEGTIGDVFDLPAWFVANYTVTATGESSGVASTTFTDAVVANASVAEKSAGRNTTGNTFTFTVNNVSTASEQIRSIRISSPGGYLDITACSTTLSGWSTGNPGGMVDANGSDCFITSTAGAATIPAGGTATFTVTALLNQGDNATGDWSVRVNTTNAFTGGGTNATATVLNALKNDGFAYWITNAVVAASAATVGAACPAPGTSAPAGSSRVIVICGVNGVNNNTDLIPATYTGSTLSGSMIGTPGTLSGGGTFVNTPNAVRVLANWTTTIGAAGTNRDISVHIGSKPPNNARTSQLANFGGYDSRFGTSLAVDAATGTYGGTTTLSATLTQTPGGAALSGKSISFTLNGTSVGSATTNASGVATLPGVSLAGIDAGSYPGAVVASFTADSTHTGSTGSASLTVAKADTTTAVTCAAGPFTFNGSAQTPCTAKVTGAGGLDQALTVSYSDNTNAGTATASASYAGTANYKPSSDSKTFEIGKADPAVSITWADTTYDGNPHPATASVTGVGTPPANLGAADSLTYYAGATASGTPLAGAPTNAGTYTVKADYNGSANYKPASAVKTIEIAKADTTTTVTCGAGSFTFNGSPQTPCTAKVTGPGGLDQALTVDYTDNTNAGTATASASYPGSANYKPSSDSKTFEIGKADTTTTVTCGAGPFTFNGSAQTPCTAKVTGPGGLDQALTVNYADNTNAGTATASASYAGSANYKASSDSETFEIGKADPTVSITWADTTYDGSPHPATASVTGVGTPPADLGAADSLTYYAGATATGTPLAGAPTDAGTYTVKADYNGSPNYKPASAEKTIEIAKADTTTTVSCAAGPFTFNGSPQTPCTAKVTGPAGLDQALTVDYTDNTNAGTATASASYPGSANYKPSSDSKTFEIAKADTTTAVTCGAGPFTFNGSAQTPCTAKVTGPGGLDQALTVSYSDNTNAGTATASASYAGTANYKPSSDSKTFEIGKADPTVSITWADTTYDGNPHPATASVSGVGTPAANLGAADSLTYYAGSTATGTPLAGAPTNAGTYTVKADYNGSSNYKPASAVKTIEIAKADAHVSITWADVDFDGNAHPATASVSGVGSPPANLGAADSLTYYAGTDTTGTALAGAPTDAGTYTVKAQYNGSTNYKPASAEKTIEIRKAATTTTVSCDPGPFSFNGSAQTPCTAKATGPGGLDQTLTVDYTDNTNAGTATASASYAGTANYKPSSDSTMFEIGKADTTTTVTCGAGPFTFNGSAQTPCSAKVTGPGGLDQPLTVDYSNNTNAGTATASASYAGTANYKPSSDSKTFEIGKADPTVSITWADVDFDGNAHAATASVSGVGSPPANLGAADSLTYYAGATATGTPLAGAPTDAGTYTVKAQYNGSANYKPTSAEKTIEIRKADTTTTVTCGAGPFTFDGSAHTPCSAKVTGPAGLDQTLTVSYSNNTNAGTATASASYPGSANYKSSTDSETFEIGKADTTTAATCTGGPFSFNGSAHTPCSAKVTGPAGLDQSLTVNYSDNTNAGTATANASYAGSGNYKASNDSKHFDIGKADTTTAVSCPASITHTGSALEPCSAIVTGSGGLNQGVPVTYTDNTNVGTATASAAYTGAANYKASSDSKTFTITTACRTSGTFQAPIKEGTRMVVKLGNVIPVKLRLADCNNVLVTGRTLSIRVIAGIVNGDDVVDGSEIIPTSVSSADSTGIMRYVDSNHMYNLATKGLGTGLPYTIVIRDTTTAAWSSAPTVGTAVIEPKK